MESLIWKQCDVAGIVTVVEHDTVKEPESELNLTFQGGFILLSMQTERHCDTVGSITLS